MKVFAAALLLLVAVSSGWALQCQNCIMEGPDSVSCVETEVTCPPELDACAKITHPAPNQHIVHKSCFKMTECLKMVGSGLQVSCCNWNGCNK